MTPDGLVNETSTWLSSHSDLFQWDEVKYVTILTNGNHSIFFFERGAAGWKVLFGKDQVPELKEILKKYIPDVEISEINR